MVIPSQPRKASWLSDLLRHRTAKEAPLEFVIVATQRLRLNHFVPLCIFLRLPQGDTQQNNRNMLDLDSFYAGLFP